MMILERKAKKNTIGAIILFYLVIVFEFFYMASPFAAYFYSIYKPGLIFLDQYPVFTWLNSFFLPHLVEETKSDILNSLQIIGFSLACIGGTSFLICAIQVYSSKILKKGAVIWGLYKHIRHPQYTAFIICSFGLLLLWPRFIALIFWVIVIFAYYVLAKIEERECLSKFGEQYSAYLKETPMFIPRILNKYTNNRPITAIKLLAIFVITLSLSICAAFLVKAYSISQLFSSTKNGINYVSVHKLSDKEFDSIHNILNNNNILNKYINLSDNNVLAYILPQDLYISEIPMIIPENSDCHVQKKNLDIKNIKVIFVNTNIAEKKNSIYTMLLYNNKIPKPIIEVHLNAESNVVSTFLLSDNNLKYNNLRMPLF